MRQHAFKRGILVFNRAHRIVNDLAKLIVKIERGAVGLFLIGFSHDVTAQVCALNPVASIPGCVLHPSGDELRSMLNFHNEYALKPNHGPVDNSRSKPIETGFSLRNKITALAIKLPAPRFARKLFVNPFKAS